MKKKPKIIHLSLVFTLRMCPFFFKYVLNSLKKLLETVDTPRLMMQIAKTILQLSKFYPDSTFNIFQVCSYIIYIFIFIIEL